MTTPEMTPAAVLAALPAFVAALQACETSVALGRRVVQFECAPSAKFARVFHVSGPSRSAMYFVELSTGLVWKSASWKRPALNFPRGHVLKGIEGVFSMPAVVAVHGEVA